MGEVDPGAFAQGESWRGLAQAADLGTLGEKVPACQIRPSDGKSETRPWDPAGPCPLAGHAPELRLPGASGPELWWLSSPHRPQCHLTHRALWER